MDAQDYKFFEEHGYLELGKLLTDEEVQHYLELYDRDRASNQCCWHRTPGLTGLADTPSGSSIISINLDVLVSSPEFDTLVRHPKVLPIAEALMGGPICFSEILLRHVVPYDGEHSTGWHRDKPHWIDHPLRTAFLQLTVYLTDVDESTHCLTLSPESAHEPILDREAQLKRSGSHDVYGPAGTATIWNVSMFHGVTVKPTQRERKSAQIYYGHRDRPYLSQQSIIPATLWRDHPDPEVRAFYGNLNDRTRIYMAAAGVEAIPSFDMAPHR